MTARTGFDATAMLTHLRERDLEIVGCWDKSMDARVWRQAHRALTEAIGARVCLGWSHMDAVATVAPHTSTLLLRFIESGDPIRPESLSSTCFLAASAIRRLSATEKERARQAVEKRGWQVGTSRTGVIAALLGQQNPRDGSDHSYPPAFPSLSTEAVGDSEEELDDWIKALLNRSQTGLPPQSGDRRAPGLVEVGEAALLHSWKPVLASWSE